MSLADVKAQAEKEVAEKNQVADGVYPVRMKDWEFKKSQNGKDMYVLTWKITKDIDDDAEVKVKGKTRKTYYVLSEAWAKKDLLDLVESMGANLDLLEELSELDEVFEAIEDTRLPKAKLEVKNVEGKKYPELTLTEVEAVLDEDSEINQPKEKEDKSKSKGKSKGKGKASKKAPEPDNDDDDDDDDDDVTAPD